MRPRAQGPEDEQDKHDKRLLGKLQAAYGS